MSIPNLLMVIATLMVFFVFSRVIQGLVTAGNAGVSASAPDYIISSAIPGIMTLFIFLSIIVYGLIRY
jgi:hypothetical protein